MKLLICFWCVAALLDTFEHNSVAYCRLRAKSWPGPTSPETRLDKKDGTRHSPMLQTIVEPKADLAAYAAQYPISVLSVDLTTKVVAAFRAN